jgi:hypothetical protein
MPRSSPKRSDRRHLASPSISVVMSCRTCRHKRWMRWTYCSADELRWGQKRIQIAKPSKSDFERIHAEVASFQDSQWAGGTGIAPAPCGCGACCRSFKNVQGRTRRGWKWPILTVQSVRKFTNVHRRWGQHWGHVSVIDHSQGQRSMRPRRGLIAMTPKARQHVPYPRQCLHGVHVVSCHFAYDSSPFTQRLNQLTTRASRSR